MNKTLLRLNRDYIKKEVNKHIDRFFNDLKILNEKLEEQEHLIKKLEYSRTAFARGYAIKLGILKIRK